MHTPILTANDCEGAGEVFAVEVKLSDVFVLTVMLTVSYDHSLANRHSCST